MPNLFTLDTSRPILIAGPCSMESSQILAETAEELVNIGKDLDIDVVFKSSFDKANRTSADSYRSFGLAKGLEELAAIGEAFEIPVTTDVHETYQVQVAAEVVDILQIPAFLCRQTDLLVACGETGLPVNIKKGQFMAPRDMQYAVAKVAMTGNEGSLLTERGTTFGYHDLVVDFRSLLEMRKYAPVIYDVTHSVQQPGAMNGSSGGARHLAGPLARAAVAVGVDGLFIETHPDPDSAKSDGPNMIPLDDLKDELRRLLQIWRT